MCYNEKLEKMTREEIKKHQGEKLKEMIERIYENVPFYKEKLDSMGISPEDINSVDDLSKLPFTYKQDMRDNYPFGLFAANEKDIVRIHASSGTTGKPTVVGYTQNDIDAWSDLVARGIVACGGSMEDTIQVSYGYGLFTGGLGLHYGAETLGCKVVPMSGGNSSKQIMLMNDFEAGILACTPSYALNLAETLNQGPVKKDDISLKIGIFGAEPWSENMRNEIEKALNIKAYDIYGLSEIMGPGVGIECEAQEGLHIWEDHFIIEIIDPETMEVLPEGSDGELVITTITKEGIPLLRYRTRDLTSMTTKECKCGRTHARIKRITARSDDMLIIRGVNVYPSQIESVLLEAEGIAPHYQLVVTREGILDNLEINIELSEDFAFDTISSLETLAKTIKDKVQSILGISAKIKLVEPKSIPRSEGKAVRVIDKRKEN